jgi:diguanylate cyclase (GGDEF)-like protein
MGYLQLLRACFGAIVLFSIVAAPRYVGASLAELGLATGAYLLVTATSEGFRRMGRGRGLGIVTTMLLMDGVYLGWVLFSTGGGASPLRFLIFVHLIAVTLLASYRTGLKIALWHSLLFFVVFYAEAAGLLHARAAAKAASAAHFHTDSLFFALSIWLVAIGTATFSAINERELRRRKMDLEALAAMAEELETTTEPEAAAGVFLDHLCRTFGFKRGLVLGGRHEDLELLAYKGPETPPAVREEPDGSIAEAWGARSPVLVKRLDPKRDPRISTLLPFVRNVVVVPLFAERQPIGAVVVEHASPRIERRVVDMAAQFAAHAALALSRAWALQQMQKMADTDALTGVPNRRSFETSLERELSRSHRSGEQLTLALFDVDRFKSLNDEFGHQTGDEVLKEVAAALASACRDFDLPARYGGEEFAVILPSCSVKESLVVAERLRHAVARIITVRPITVSAGVATFPTHATDAPSLIKAADEALYESKRLGRDRVTRSRRRGRVKSRSEV